MSFTMTHLRYFDLGSNAIIGFQDAKYLNEKRDVSF